MSNSRRKLEGAVAALALLGFLVIAVSLGAGSSAPPPEQQTPAAKPEPILPLADLATVTGLKLSLGKTYDNQPAVAQTADGTTWIAYVRYHNRGADEVVVVSRKGDQTSEPVILSPGPGQYIRPALAAGENEAWCLWTASEPTHPSSIWYSRLSGQTWSKAARLLPEESRAHQNPEVAAGPGGKAVAVYQIHRGKGYDIHLQRSEAGRWGSPLPLSEPGANCWDPAVALDRQGLAHAVWCEFRDGDYDILWRRADGTSKPRRLSARGDYDLHPWIAAAPDGAVWVSWDVLHLPRHGNSGRTTITGANQKFDEAEGGYRTAVKFSGVEVRVLAGDDILIPGRPREEIVAPKGYQIAHTAYAKVEIGPGGEPWAFYRALRRAINTPGIGFYWDLLGRPFRNGQWGEAVRFASSDGYLEEPAVASSPRGIQIAYGGEERLLHLPKAPGAKGAKPHPEADRLSEPTCEGTGADHHHDFDAIKGWNGEIYLASAGEPSSPGPDRALLKAASAPRDVAVPPRTRIEPYQSTLGGKTYQLLFGDLHRHSNVSRCSQGSEPTPDDLYRYGTDICCYDFFGLSDHAEDPRQMSYDRVDYYWWKQQKLADLYHIPGFLSVLYDLEWSLKFPHGHHNTIFPSRPTLRLDQSLALSSTLAGGWKLLEKNGLKAITIPHTGADPSMGTAWEIQDDRYQRLCEIFQACRGSYEHSGCPREFFNTKNKKGFYWNALEKGYHVGVICSSDHGYGVSYACVYAAENTREAVWQALYDRRTYGSTTYGLVLDLKSGPHWMGEEWETKEAPELEIFVRGAVPLRSIEIIGRSKVLHSLGSVKEPINAREQRLRWSDPEWAAQGAEQWYYVRVIQTNDEMAWSSPVWVKPAK